MSLHLLERAAPQSYLNAGAVFWLLVSGRAQSRRPMMEARDVGNGVERCGAVVFSGSIISSRSTSQSPFGVLAVSA